MMVETVMDHNGNSFYNIDSMLEYYKLSKDTFCRRMAKGWSLERTLCTLDGDPEIPDTKFDIITLKEVLKERYNDFVKLLSGYGVSITEVIYSINLCIEGSKEKEDNTVKDSFGNEYASIEDLCDKYGIPENVFKNRLKIGMTLEEALNLPYRNDKENLEDAYSSIKDTYEKKYKDRVISKFDAEDSKDNNDNGVVWDKYFGEVNTQDKDNKDNN